MHLAVGDSGKNDHHFIVYEPEPKEDEMEESYKKLKNFRDLHVQNLISSLRLKFYVCSNEALAKKLGIDTTKPGDMYLIRQAGTAFT